MNFYRPTVAQCAWRLLVEVSRPFWRAVKAFERGDITHHELSEKRAAYVEARDAWKRISNGGAKQ
jgi:hypothetical protein